MSMAASWACTDLLEEHAFYYRPPYSVYILEAERLAERLWCVLLRTPVISHLHRCSGFSGNINFFVDERTCIHFVRNALLPLPSPLATHVELGGGIRMGDNSLAAELCQSRGWAHEDGEQLVQEMWPEGIREHLTGLHESSNFLSLHTVVRWFTSTLWHLWAL